ncbi:hemophore-related protein [Nocardia brasiliensis]|uniref:hemophore-related protein n=1 Tax=Nocardia brasiliensis TaxID=37326 RepID=UPI00366FFC7B
MKMRKTRYTIAALAIGAVSAGTALLGAGTAAANPIDDMVGLLVTKCSFSQFDTALHDVAPEAAAKLDASPIHKTALEMTLSAPADQRAAIFGMLTNHRAQIEAMTDTSAANAESGAVMSKVAASCHRY